MAVKAKKIVENKNVSSFADLKGFKETLSAKEHKVLFTLKGYRFKDKTQKEEVFLGEFDFRKDLEEYEEATKGLSEEQITKYEYKEFCETASKILQRLKTNHTKLFVDNHRFLWQRDGANIHTAHFVLESVDGKMRMDTLKLEGVTELFTHDDYIQFMLDCRGQGLKKPKLFTIKNMPYIPFKELDGYVGDIIEGNAQMEEADFNGDFKEIVWDAIKYGRRAYIRDNHCVIFQKEGVDIIKLDIPNFMV